MPLDKRQKADLDNYITGHYGENQFQMYQVDETNDAKCFLKANQQGEPTFTLRAQDKLAPAIIANWIGCAQLQGVNSEKILDASRDLTTFLEWQKNNPERVKLPD